MTVRVYKIITKGIVDLTSSMSGITASWQYEVDKVWIDGVDTAFTWSSGAVSIPTYTTGTVKARFILYMIDGTASKHAPKDPENALSDEVFYDERLARFPSIGSSIGAFETGRITYKISNIVITALGTWQDLLENSIDFIGTDIIIYENDVKIFQAICNGHTIERGRITVVIKNITSALNSKCTFGDPDYLNKIDPNHSSSFYNGAAIDQKYHGYTIPFVIGDRMAYEDDQNQTVATGTYNYAGVPPLVPFQGGNVSSFGVGKGFICKVIPTSTSTGIVCRIPAGQALATNVVTTAETGAQFSEYDASLFGARSITPQAFVRIRTTGLVYLSGRTYNSSGGSVIMSYDVSGGGAGVNFDQYTYDETLHICGNYMPPTNWNPANVTLSYQNTPGGHRLVTINVGAAMLTSDTYVVCTSLTGSMTFANSLKYILESHDLTCDASSFSSIASSYPYEICAQIGNNKDMPTLNEVIGNFNKSLLTYNRIPLDNSTIYMGDVDLNPSPTITLTDSELTNVNVRYSGNNLYAYTDFEPIYAKGSGYRSDVFERKTDNSVTEIYGIDSAITHPHVLTEKPSTRWDEIAEFNSKPECLISFILLDDSISVELGDYVTISHEDFDGDIIVTSINLKRLGKAISGRKIK